MIKTSVLKGGIPVSISLVSTLESENMQPQGSARKKRVLTISLVAVCIAMAVSGIARLLVYLIDICTNLSFYGHLSAVPSSPANNHLGWAVIFVPVAGGIIVGLMALYGSKAIRGHGIPEAMEQILTNQSRIRPAITYLKPLSSAITIGTGGPFGAEGPIIATGGALGSTVGQLLKITHHERKILLAAGATAGMSAIFGSPVAAIFLAIELLLFEFSARTIIPVALACITGAAGHHFLFGQQPVFAMAVPVLPATNTALAIYSGMGIAIGLIAIFITKFVYLTEDLFEHLPVHWMWWPAIGGLAVGITGYFSPRTLGVGYNNITDILAGTMPFEVVLSLCLCKFISWAIALASGTSGGTLAPLLTIGGATGALLGTSMMMLFPSAGVSIPLSALVGMSAMFAGASRAFLTSIIFALETTSQSNALLPLLSTCSASYFVSFFLMKNTIMTEKIARRGVKTPDSYEPDLLEKITVQQVMESNGVTISGGTSIHEAAEWLNEEPEYNGNYLIISDEEGKYKGILSSSSLFSRHHKPEAPVDSLVKRKDISIGAESNLRKAVEIMARENVDVLPVVSDENNITGILSYHNIISAYKQGIEEHTSKHPRISLKRKGFKILIKGQRLINAGRKKANNV